MKTYMFLVSLGFILIVGTASYFKWNGEKPARVPLSATAQPDLAEPAKAVETSVEESVVLSPTTEPAAETVAQGNLLEAASAPTVDPVPAPTPFSRAIDTLVSPQCSFKQKQAAWRQLQDAGQLEQAIAALKQGAGQNPDSAAYPAALGQAQLYQAGVVAHKGGAISEMGILGMQADQSFDMALKLDPANWEAQFFKAAAMSHWPLELNKGEEVIQRLSQLVDQQEALPAEPQFAQTYVLLGDQYQKMGKPDYAMAAWQLGVKQFQGDPSLQKKIAGQ